MESRFTKIAVVTIVIVAILIGVGRFAGNDVAKPIVVKDAPTAKEKIEVNEPVIEKFAEDLAGVGESPFNAAVESLRQTVIEQEIEEAESQPELEETTVQKEDRISQKAKEVRVYKDNAPAMPGILSGHVIDELGNPVSGAMVYANAPDLDRTIPARGWRMCKEQPTGLTDNNGCFAITLPGYAASSYMPVVIWAILLEEPDFVAWTIIRSKRDKDEYPFGDNEPGDIGEDYVGSNAWFAGASDITLVMEPARIIYGRVVNIYGEPISNATINVYPEMADKNGKPIYFNDEIIWQCAGETNKDGYYEVGYLPRLWDKCSFLTRVSAQGYAALSKKLQIADSLEFNEVDFTVYELMVTIRGTLVDNYGTTLAGRLIMPRVGGKDFAYGHTSMVRTDKDGRFELEAAPYSEDLQLKAVLSHNASFDPNLVYCPDVIVDVGCVAGQLEYEVNLTAEMPEIVIDVEVVDSAGMPIPYFPVAVQAYSDSMYTWRNQRNLSKRTNEYGRLTLTQVPDIKGLHLSFRGERSWSNCNLKDKDKVIIQQISKEYRKYKSINIPIEVIDGVKEYSVRAVILTREEYQRDMELNNQ